MRQTLHGFRARRPSIRNLPVVRLAVYTDYAYRRDASGVYADRAFALFLARLSHEVERMILIGRLSPTPARSRYRIPDEVELVALPFYASLARPASAAGAMARSLARFWRSLDEVDTVWLLGPHPLAIAFAGMAGLRGKRVALGVRQDLPQYARTRHPGKRAIALAADLLDGLYRALGRLLPVVVVGPSLARRYRGCPRLLEITVSLIAAAQLAEPDAALARDYAADELVVLSVGRIEEEKNPLLLAEIAALLARDSQRSWRFVICGEGPLQPALAGRLDTLGVADRVEMRGYVRFDDLWREYQTSHLLLHVSWTEGMPQVLVEAAAAGLPMVATDVGGVAAALGESVSLIPAGDAPAAAAALRALADSASLRHDRVSRALRFASQHTIESETARLAAFLRAPG